jgi:hypothetical protein
MLNVNKKVVLVTAGNQEGTPIGGWMSEPECHGRRIE